MKQTFFINFSKFVRYSILYDAMFINDISYTCHDLNEFTSFLSYQKLIRNLKTVLFSHWILGAWLASCAGMVCSCLQMSAWCTACKWGASKLSWEASALLICVLVLLLYDFLSVHDVGRCPKSSSSPLILQPSLSLKPSLYLPIQSKDITIFGFSLCAAFYTGCPDLNCVRFLKIAK